MNDIVEMPDRGQSLKTIGHISYLLHLIVARMQSMRELSPAFVPS